MKAEHLVHLVPGLRKHGGVGSMGYRGQIKNPNGIALLERMSFWFGTEYEEKSTVLDTGGKYPG